MMVALHRVMAVAELAAPPGAQGAFVPATNTFDGYAALPLAWVRTEGKFALPSGLQFLYTQIDGKG